MNALSDTLQITEIPVEGYERVVRGVDPQSGLHAIIAVHDTTLGPALGGLRMWNYASEQEALFDVERLAKGMSYKSAVARTGLGGGKAVIIGDAKTIKSEALYLGMGRLVDPQGEDQEADDEDDVDDLGIQGRPLRSARGRL